MVLPKAIICTFELKNNKHVRFYIFFVLFRLTEDQWVTHETRLPVTRELMMVALQNVQRIFIRATGKIIE